MLNVKKLFGIILLIMYCFALFELGLRITGFVLLSQQKLENQIIIDNSKNEIKILTLGESTTAEVFGGDRQWPSYLEEILNNRSDSKKFTVINEAVPGIYTSTLLRYLEYNIEKYQPDIVITMMGINDKMFMIDQPYIKTNINSKLNFFKSYKFIRLVLDNIKKKDNELANEIISDIDASKVNYKDKHLLMALAANPKNISAHMQLASLYYSQARFEDAQDQYTNALKINKNIAEAYVGLGWISHHRYYAYKWGHPPNKDNISLYVYINPIDLFNKAISLDPNIYDAYLGLGHSYKTEYNYDLLQRGQLDDVLVDKATNAFLKAIQLEPNLESAYFGLGEVYQSQNETEKAIMMYKKVITLNPSHQDAYYQIDKIYRGREMYEEAIAFYEDARKEYPNSEWPLRFLSTYHSPSVYSQKLISTANNISDNYFTPITKNNYLMVYQLLNKNNVTLIAMQYPMRPVEDLKRLFQGDENIIFVSNEYNFRRALLNSSYQDLFIDLFAGDFGHTTDSGNKLIAENIANHIFEYLELESKNEKNNN